MKTTFFEYQINDADMISAIWKNAFFVFDTNVLLSLYRYSKDTSDMFIKVISELNDRVWLPYQVGLEFYRNRLQVVSEQKKQYEIFRKEFKDLIDKIENKNRNPFFSQTLTDKITDINIQLNCEIDNIITQYDNFICEDPILKQIHCIFDKKIGKEYQIDKYNAIIKDGNERYKNRIPPGYCDEKKSNNDKFGDLILWNQIIDKAKEIQNEIIFILDDRKEDWWLEHQGKTISPRPELIKEFKTTTNRLIHFYKPFQFLEYSKVYLNKDIQKETIEEVRSYIVNDSNSNILIIKVELSGPVQGINKLIKILEATGYKLTSEIDSNTNIHFLNITLPDIPDLERRLYSRHLSSLEDYNLILNRIDKSV
ncbi:MAG: DUF4935 domain-containing protein [Bacteroidales bacterium]|nr:DUF4935 domain-containing protein [Bacteroidales bacterium]